MSSSGLAPGWAEAVPSPDGRDADEYGIEWSDGVFTGPFDRQATAEEYLIEQDIAPAGITGRIIARVVEYGPWETVS